MRERPPVIGATTPILETQRLKLREFSQDDLDDLAAMVADEDQMGFYPRPKTRDEASAWISRNLALYKEYGFGFWFIESLPTSGFLGYCGIRPLAMEGVSEIEIGWHTKKTFWNQGIATEAAMAARDLAFRCFGLLRLVAIIHPDHIASRRVAENIGMRDEKTAILDDYPAVIYTTERS
jgi:RimJ/RimL family protein N-acetyltransferase